MFISSELDVFHFVTHRAKLCPQSHCAMDVNSLRTLKLLEEINRDNTLSQRDLAKAMNISLGLVNLFIKRLVKKGYFKITTIPKNRAKYILTPNGLAEKTRLTYEFIQYSFEFYRKAKQRLQVLLKALVEQNVRRVVLYGANDLAEITFISLQEIPIDIVAVVDDTKAGHTFFGSPILESTDLRSIYFDRILITQTDDVPQALELTAEQHIPTEKVVVLA